MSWCASAAPSSVSSGVEFQSKKDKRVASSLSLNETRAGLVYADVQRVNDDGVNPRRIRSRSPWNLWTELNLGCGIFSPSVFFTRAAYEAAGEIDETLDLTMDYDLWLRIGQRFEVRHITQVPDVWRPPGVPSGRLWAWLLPGRRPPC